MTATLEPETASAAAATDPPRRPRASRLSTGHLLIALAAIVAVVGNYAVLRAQDHRVRVAVVATEVPAGAAVDASALTFADVRVDDAVLATLVRAADLAALDGHVATTRLVPGDLLRRSDLAAPATRDGHRAMSIPLPPEHAVAGRLTAGDRVDVIDVRDGHAVYLATAAEVLDVGDGDARAGLGGLRSFSVTLAVDDETALRLALARRHGDLHLVRSTGASPAATAEVRETGDAARAGRP